MGLAAKLAAPPPTVQTGKAPEASSDHLKETQVSQTPVVGEDQQGGQPAYPTVFTPYPNVSYDSLPQPQLLQPYGQQTSVWGQGQPSVAQGQPVAHQQGLNQQHRFYVDEESVRNKLRTIVQQNQLHTFYSPQAITHLARQVAQVDLLALARNWKLPQQMVMDLVSLSLYDTVIMCDDSGSMRLFEDGERIKDLKAILERVASVCGLLDTDGITIHTMNNILQKDHVRGATEAAAFVEKIHFEGATPLGSMLERKILHPYVYGPIKNGRLHKPVQVIVITDGEPTAEPPKQLRKAISHVKDFLKSTRYGAGAVAFQFAQVGSDENAQRFLSDLDNDKKVGRMVDCTSSYEQEQEEYLRASDPRSLKDFVVLSDTSLCAGIHLTPDMYLNKLCLGAIDRSYDEQDELRQNKQSFLKRLFA